MQKMRRSSASRSRSSRPDRVGTQSVSKRSLGFTLLELLVVVTIVSLVAGVVTVRLTGMTTKARWEWSLGELVQSDAMLRSLAKSRRTPLRCEIDLPSGTVRQFHRRGSSRPIEKTLANRIEIIRFLTAKQDVSAGKIEIHYTSAGASPTYALGVRPIGKEHPPTWLVFIGATGMMERLEDEREVVRLVRSSNASRDDAD